MVWANGFVQVLEIVLVWILAIAWFGLDMSDWVFWVMIGFGKMVWFGFV